MCPSIGSDSANTYTSALIHRSKLQVDPAFSHSTPKAHGKCTSKGCQNVENCTGHHDKCTSKGCQTLNVERFGNVSKRGTHLFFRASHLARNAQYAAHMTHYDKGTQRLKADGVSSPRSKPPCPGPAPRKPDVSGPKTRSRSPGPAIWTHFWSVHNRFGARNGQTSGPGPGPGQGEFTNRSGSWWLTPRLL
jgi:hypothetical protein